jgi:hypothetical protein
MEIGVIIDVGSDTLAPDAEAGEQVNCNCTNKQLREGIVNLGISRMTAAAFIAAAVFMGRPRPRWPRER